MQSEDTGSGDIHQRPCPDPASAERRSCVRDDAELPPRRFLHEIQPVLAEVHFVTDEEGRRAEGAA